jgi:microcystin-dependent protein
MQRLFTKVADGSNPNGRWFAGDVNALEDAVAAITDLTQALSVGSVAIGESGLQIVRYGSGEVRLSGKLRTDGIVRALGGLFAGAFTTAARDAITSPPFTLIIFNTSTNQFEWNAGTDSSPSWQPLGGTPASSTAGALADLPDASDAGAGGTYFATDQFSQRVSDGTSWHRVGLPAGAVVQTLGSTADDGFILLRGQAWPSTGGIYADLYARYGNPASVPDAQGKTMAGYESGDDTFGVLGASVGEKKHTMLLTELVAHHHVYVGTPGSGGSVQGGSPTGGNANTSDTGGSTPFNVVQPTLVGNWQAKL